MSEITVSKAEAALVSGGGAAVSALLVGASLTSSLEIGALAALVSLGYHAAKQAVS